MKKEIIKPVEGYRPKLIIFVVYKTKDGGWRGFCSPYDVTCEAKKKTEAMDRLERLVKLYEKGLGKYGYPKHLSIRPLSDREDKIVFEKVKKKIVSNIERNFLRFQAEKRKETFQIKNPMSPSGYYLCPT